MTESEILNWNNPPSWLQGGTVCFDIYIREQAAKEYIKKHPEILETEIPESAVCL